MESLEFFLDYWTFFGSTWFDRNSKLTIFDDGSFAILTEDGVFLYNKTCQLVKGFSPKAKVFPNGGIAVWRDEGEVVAWDVFFKGCKKYSLQLEAVLDRKKKMFFRQSGNVLIYDKDNVVNGYVLSKEQARPVQFPDGYVGIDSHLWQGSDNGMVFAVGMSKKDDRRCFLFDEKGCDISLKAEDNKIFDVSFMKCGSYIVNTYSGSVLFDREGKRLLCSLQDDGITSGIINCGGYYVRYADTLLVNGSSGYILGECGREIAVAPGGTKIFAYKIENDNGVGYWLGGQFDLFQICDMTVMSYFHDGRYFVAVIEDDDEACRLERSMLLGQGIKGNLGLYENRILQMIP